MMPDSSLFAATQYGLYHRPKNSGKWLPSSLSLGMERLSDVACLGDSLVVISRDRAFLALPPYSSFSQISLPAGSDYEGKVSLFRVVWLLHSGEMFGMAGKIVLDLLGVVMALLSVSGLLFWLFPKFIKRGFKKVWLISSTRFSFKSHNMVGIFTFVLLVFVVFTGWWLRPPLLIPLALNKMQGISGTAMSPDQPWQDKLRTIRYDNAAGDWILTTSDGFYSLSRSFEGVPQAMANAPHVSVMGVTVMQKDAQGRWLVGSLSGMWKWNRAEGKSVDYFTGEPMPEKAGAPFGKTPVAGFSSDFGAPIVAEYDDGNQSLPQPDSLRNLPMSLWQLALEIHTGRIYNLFGLAPLIWVFLAGFLALWLLISGWKIRQSLKK